MIEACPNLNDPEVAREFNEIKEATSEKTAYNIWSLNNGYGIDKAPNGAESILFQSLLSECKGDRMAAIRAKAALYGNNFRSWFGDWLHEPVAGVTRIVDNDGKIRLRLESHTKEHPREIVLDPLGENKYYVHTRTWDGDHVPADMSLEDKQKLYEAFYRELPDNAEVLFPQSDDNYLATRGTVANLIRLSRDDRFEKGKLSGTMKYTDKDGTVKEYSGTSFIKKPSVSKVVDLNGEPLVVYHGTLSEFSVFDFNRLGETTGLGYYTDHITGEKIPIDSSYAFFFTDNKYGARSYKNLAVWHQNTFRALVYRNLFAIFGNSKFDYVRFEGKEKQAQRDFINNIVSPYLGFDVLREANKIISGESAFTKEQRSLYAEKFLKIENKIENLPDARLVSNLANNLLNYKDDLRFILEHKLDLIDGIPILRLADSIIRISTGYGSWEKGDVSLTIYNENENGYSVLGLTKKNGDFKKITADNFDELVNEFKRGILLVEEELKQYERAGHYDTNGNVISVFLNIKNPLEHDYNNSPFPDAYLINAKEDDPDASNYDASGVLKKPLRIKGKRVPTAYVAARQVKKARNDGNDGVVYKNVQDPFKMTSYGIFGANQVKSAVGNREIEQPGTGFSTTNNSIYANMAQNNGQDEYINPYAAKRNNKYIYLSEKTSELFESYLEKSHGVLPKRFFDESKQFEYIKSNNRKNSRLYDVVDARTGEIIARKKKILTKDEQDSLKNAKQEVEDKFKHYTLGTSFAFKKRISTPSKGLFKQMAKQYLYEAIKVTSDISENIINFDIIDKFVDQFDDSVWEHIITYNLNPTHGPEHSQKAYGPSLFGMATNSFQEVFNRFAFNRTIPKQGLINEMQKRLNLDLTTFRFSGYIEGIYYDKVPITRNLPYNVLEKMLLACAKKQMHLTEEESIKAYAKHVGVSVDDVKRKMEQLRDEDTIESSKALERIRNYHPAQSVLHDILSEYNLQYKTWLDEKGIKIPKNVVNIIFNRDSSWGEDTPIIRLATIMHEPFHALEMLHNGSKEHAAVLQALDNFLNTSYGKQVWLEYQRANVSYSQNELKSEFLADLFSIMMMPKQLYELYAALDAPFLGSQLAKTIRSILERPEFKTIILSSPKTKYEEFTELQKTVLPLIKQIYNAIIKWLSQYSKFVKSVFSLYEETQDVKIQNPVYDFESREEKIFDDDLIEFKEALSNLSDMMQYLASLEVEESDVVDSSSFFMQGGTQSYFDTAAEFLANSPAIQTAFEVQRENYIRSNNPQTEDERDKLARDFDLDQMLLNTTKAINAIASEYGVSVANGQYFASDPKNKYIVMLLNNMNKRLSDPKFASTEARFLLDTVIGTNDISTLIMQMARVYIEDFYEADAIQEVMKMIDPSGKMHRDDLIDTLTDMVTKAVIDPSSTEFGTVSKINNTILNFVRKRFNLNTISEQAKRILIDTIAKNMACCEDLQRTNTEDLLHDVKWYEITGKESLVTPKNIIDAIKKGIKTQLRSLLSVTTVDKDKVLILNQLLAKLEDIDIDNNPDDVLGVVSDFIADGMQDINKANATLRQMLSVDPSLIDSKKLYSIRTDVIGYYRSIINNYIVPFTRNTTNPTLQPGGALYATVANILDKCTHTQQLYDYVLRQHVEKMIDDFVDSNVNIGDKERFKVNCKLWLHNKINNGDLGFFENWIKSAVSSHSPIVRIVDDFVRQLDTEVRQLSLKKSRLLLKIYKKTESTLAKMSPFNYQRNFCEIDDDGQTTGNFIAEVNVGQFEKEKRTFIENWAAAHSALGVMINEEGSIEFPDDVLWKKFNDDLDDFLDGRQHRRYTSEYYKLEREYMSKDTIEYKRNIRKRIQLLYDKCYDEDIQAPNIWKLDRDDYQSLQDLLKIQLNLSNPYIITYDANGKIDKIEEKVGDQLRMANEIAAFNHALAGKIKFTPNYDKYNAAKEAMKNKFGENSNEYKAFVYNFSTRAVSPLYYAKLEEIFGPRSSEVIDGLDEINNKIRAIINATITKRGKYVQDLSKMNDAAYAELKRLEEQKENLLSSVNTVSGRKLTSEEKSELDSMHHSEYVINPATGVPVITELEQEYRQRGQYLEFLNKFFVVSPREVRPLSIFIYDNIHPEYIDEESPIGMFSDIDTSSEFVDPEYNPEDDEFMNIDRQRYHNSKYDDIVADPEAYKFYKALLNTMEEAWSMLPNINRHYKYMLPLRRGSISQLAARDIINTFTGRKGRDKLSFGQVIKNVVKLVTAGALGGLAFGGLAALLPGAWISMSAAIISGVGYGAISGLVAGLLTRDKNIADQLLSITENDVEFNESFAIRPDGSEVETIPIRFVKRLKDPTSVSTSLIHSVSSFYEMALNYKAKEKLAPIVENIQFELSGGFNGQSITDQADRIRTHKSSMIYGRRKTGLARRSSNKMTQTEQKISKLVSFILNTTHAKMLPWNVTSIYKNLIDSTFSLLSLIVSMKSLSPQDLGVAIINMGKEIFNGTAFSNIGSPDTLSFTGAAMLHNGVHMGIADTFADTEKYWVRRVIERFYSMGPFTLIDYTFKGLFTNMVYNTYRLVLNPSTGKMEFMNKQEAQFAYAGENGGRKEGLKRWKKAKTTLRDAYIVTHDGLYLKPEYEALVKPEINGKKSYKLENRISGLVREQSAVVNGMLDTQDINKVSQNFIGAMILLMRGWMVSLLIDYNKDGQDFAVFASNTEDINTKLFGINALGSLQSKFIGSLDAFVVQSAPTDQEGLYNFATGFIERGWWVGWNKLVKNMLSMRRLTQHNKYQLRYLAMILATTTALGLATHPLYKWREQSDEMYKQNDPYNIERVASNFLYTGTVAAYSERFGLIGPFGFLNSMLELVNSPTVASSYVKDLNSILDASEDVFNIMDAMWQGQSIDQSEPMLIVKRGSFKGRTKLTKDLLKASTEMPGINTLGITNMYKSISPDAQKEKLKFYQKTIPLADIQPWLKLPKGSSGSTTTRSVKPVKKLK